MYTLGELYGRASKDPLIHQALTYYELHHNEVSFEFVLIALVMQMSATIEDMVEKLSHIPVSYQIVVNGRPFNFGESNDEKTGRSSDDNR